MDVLFGKFIFVLVLVTNTNAVNSEFISMPPCIVRMFVRQALCYPQFRPLTPTPSLEPLCNVFTKRRHGHNYFRGYSLVWSSHGRRYWERLN